MEIQYTGGAETRPAPLRPVDSAWARGFSLLELMMTVAVATILLTIAIPSFQYVTNANRTASEINGLLGDLQYARAEAIRQGQNITVCAASSTTTCSGQPDWETGWIVFLDSNPPAQAGGPALRLQSQFSSSDTFVGVNGTNNLSAVTFNREGYAVGIASGAIITLHTTPVKNAWTRCASIALSGSVTTEIYNVQNNGATCQ